MKEWGELANESKVRWNETAEYWDDYMGENSNRWHRELIRPITEKFLGIVENQQILDVASGNGNFSRRMAEI